MGRIIPYIMENKKNMFQTTNQVSSYDSTVSIVAVWTY
jgi:hypothetical protein